MRLHKGRAAGVGRFLGCGFRRILPECAARRSRLIDGGGSRRGLRLVKRRFICQIAPGRTCLTRGSGICAIARGRACLKSGLLLEMAHSARNNGHKVVAIFPQDHQGASRLVHVGCSSRLTRTKEQGSIVGAPTPPPFRGSRNGKPWRNFANCAQCAFLIPGLAIAALFRRSISILILGSTLLFNNLNVDRAVPTKSNLIYATRLFTSISEIFAAGRRARFPTLLRSKIAIESL